ncbi:MAG: Dyp-type peroxidase [Pseudomonadota bacterium]
MPSIQNGILQDIPQHALYLIFALKPETDAGAVISSLKALLPLVDGEQIVLGLGASLVHLLGGKIAGLHDFNSIAGSQVDLPATPGAVWCWCRADQREELVHQLRNLRKILAASFELQQVVDAFKVGTGRDLSGYEDGTENPEGDAAIAAAILQEDIANLNGSSFVAVQQWRHNFEQFEAMSELEQDHMIGRRKSDNLEMKDAPESAHVKRTAQENFTPEAFVLRRSMPWADAKNAGLYFVAFGKSFDAFEVQLRRMSGAEDGIVDALFKFSQPVSGAYFWCPPMKAARLDLSALGI